MSAVNPNQFKLFYGAKELKDSITQSYDVDIGEGDTTLNSMWVRKLGEAKASGLHESLHTEGVHPNTKLTVQWGGPNGDSEDPDAVHHMIYDGHHRVAAAADIEEQTGRAMWINTDNADYGQRQRVYKGLKPMHSGLKLRGKPGRPQPIGGPQFVGNPNRVRSIADGEETS
jgi:hypothetical protein